MISFFQSISKYTFVLVTALSIATLFPSCFTKCKCKDVTFTGMRIESYQKDVDSFVIVDVYAAGNNFTSPPEQTVNVTISPFSGGGTLFYNFDYSHDYRITVHPSGKLYTITKLTSSQRLEESTLTPCKTCYNSSSYMVNDTLYGDNTIRASTGLIVVN